MISIAYPDSSRDYHLHGITAISADDIWAVGRSDKQALEGRTFIVHWDGTHWDAVTSPNPSIEDNDLSDIAATSATDIWAVGVYKSAKGKDQPLVIHWDGKNWTLIKNIPLDSSKNAGLGAVAALSPTDVWVVGSYESGPPNPIQPHTDALIMHWDGSSWRDFAPPKDAKTHPYNGLGSISAQAANDIWAVGESGEGAITMHWDGSSWQLIPNPAQGVGKSLGSVVAMTHNNVWAVGTDIEANLQPISLHWDGGKWSAVESSTPMIGEALYGIARDPKGDMWTVGYSYENEDWPTYGFVGYLASSQCYDKSPGETHKP